MLCDDLSLSSPATRVDGIHVVQLVVAVLLVRPLLRLLYGVRVRAAPGAFRGPAVYACNHRSFYDPILASAFHRRPISFFARASLWRMPVAGQFLRMFRALPIDRSEPQLAIMKRMIAHLRGGFSVLIFPEGTRTRTGWLAPLRQGPALFARRAGVPLVPIYLVNSAAPWPRSRILPRLYGPPMVALYGPPLRPPQALPRRLQERWLTLALERWMAAKERRYLGQRRPLDSGPESP